jgi:two-component system KDP operon response regulator KdpE
MRSRILVVDDEPQIRRVLRVSLTGAGYVVADARSGEEAVEKLRAERFDLVLLDVNLPGMSGIETCREIRALPDVHIIMLTVRNSAQDTIAALDAGADDYVTKPFSVPELVARLKAATRRATGSVPETAKTIVISEIELDPKRRTVLKAQQPLHLTPKEFDLLHYLMAHAGVPIAHKKLLNAVWGAEYGQELEYLRTFMYQLRKKLEDDPASPQYLFTDAWLGYRFRGGDGVSN